MTGDLLGALPGLLPADAGRLPGEHDHAFDGANRLFAPRRSRSVLCAVPSPGAGRW